MSASAAGAMAELVSARVGVVRRLSRIDRGATEPTPPVFYQATLSHFDYRPLKQHERTGVGKGATDREAAAAAIGEALERYCAGQPDLRRVRRFAWNQRPGDAITPGECVLYSEAQYARPGFAHRRWREDLEVPWIAARELPGDDEVWVPTSLIYLDYLGNDADVYFCPPTSNGLAAGVDLNSAILAGLCELIERDAFLVTWLNRLPAPEIHIPESGGVAANFAAHYRRFGIETHLFMLATDIPVYAMMAVLVHRSNRPAVCVGLGCSPDPLMAAQKALFEVSQTRPGAVARAAAPDFVETLRDYCNVRTLEDHGAFFTAPERLSELDFLLQQGRTRDLASLRRFGENPAEDLDRIIAALRRADCRVLYANLTAPDLEPFPVRVVRTLATGLQPIHFGYGEERLGGTRLYRLPRHLGYATSDRDEASLNPCPHPLP
jgi:ribosomal protein S12 methylthiotransferase accessory factor